MQRRPIRTLRLCGIGFIVMWHSDTNVAFCMPFQRVCRDPQAGLPPGRSLTRATGSSGRAAQRGPRGQNRRTGPCGMRRGGQRGHGRQCCGQAPCAAHPTTVDRIPEREPRTRRRPGSKAAKRYGGTPNGPAGLRSGQRQRRAGNQIFCPVDFIAFNRIPHYCFFHVYLINLSGMRSARTKRTNSRSKVFKLAEC